MVYSITHFEKGKIFELSVKQQPEFTQKLMRLSLNPQKRMNSLQIARYLILKTDWLISTENSYEILEKKLD